MAFNRSDSADLTALKNEVNNDPANVGYAAVLDDTSALLSLLNDPANNPGGETGVPPLLAKDLWKVIAEDSATATQFEFNISNLFAMVSSLDDDISDYRTTVKGLGDAQVNTGIDALTRPLSRAEVLFADTLANGNTEQVTISRDDWIAARAS